MSTTRAAHILGRPVLGQKVAGILACVAVKTQEEEDMRASLQQAIGEVGIVQVVIRIRI
jgi:hypothetical protein